MGRKVRRSGNRSPGRRKAAECGLSDGPVAGEFKHVAGETGMSVADVRRCVFHSDNYRELERTAGGAETKEGAAVGEMAPENRSIEDILAETIARGEENVALADALLAAAKGQAVPCPEPAAAERPAEKFPPDWETEYVVRKTGLPKDRVLSCLVASMSYRIRSQLAELKTKFGRAEGVGPEDDGGKEH